MASQAEQKYSPSFSGDALMTGIIAFFGSGFLTFCIGAIFIIGIHWLVSLIWSESVAVTVSIILEAILLLISLCVGFSVGYEVYYEDAEANDPVARARWTDEVRQRTTQLRGKSRADFPISGPPQFCQTINRILDELQSKVPHRFEEVLKYLPEAVFDSTLRSQYGDGRWVTGRSHGHFYINELDDTWWWYGLFRFTFLHEVGHCIGRQRNSDPYHSEERASEYANQVISELEREEEEMKINLHIDQVKEYFEEAGEHDGREQWRCKQTGCIIRGAILHDFYRSFGNRDLCGFTYLGLPKTNEIDVRNGAVIQQFERGFVACDPHHKLDTPPGSGAIYLMHTNSEWLVRLGLIPDPELAKKNEIQV